MNLSDKAVDALSLLSDQSVGDIKYTISAESYEELEQIVVFALERFYDEYRDVALGRADADEDVEALDDLSILEQCLKDTKVLMQKAINPDAIAMHNADLCDLRKRIAALRGDTKDGANRDLALQREM